MTIICGFEVHEVAEFFPMMTATEARALLDDIAANGQMEPIVLDIHGTLIDGRNRAKACEELGFTPTTRTHDGNVERFVASQLHRRELTTSQRAMVAAKFEQRARGRAPQGANASFDAFALPPTNAEMADHLGVSVPSIERARKVMKSGADDLRQMVDEGTVTVSLASRIADLSADDQQQFVEDVRSGGKPAEAARKLTTIEQPKSPVRNVRNGRKHAGQIDALVIQLDGATAAFAGVTELDQSVTTEEATRLAGGLDEVMKTLRQILNLIKERTQ